MLVWMIICYPSTRYGWDGWLLVHRTGWANLIVCRDEICQIPVAKIGSVGWIAQINSRKLLNIDPENGLEDFRFPRFLLDFGCPAGCFFFGGAGWSYIAEKSGGWWNIKHGHPILPGCEKGRYSHVDTSHWTCQYWFSKRCWKRDSPTHSGLELPSTQCEKQWTLDSSCFHGGVKHVLNKINGQGWSFRKTNPSPTKRQVGNIINFNGSGWDGVC